MGAFAALGTFLASMARWLGLAAVAYAPSLVAKLLVVFGLTLAVNHYAGPAIHDHIAGLLANLSPNLAKLVGYCKVDKAITVVLSAAAIKIAANVALQAKPTTPP
jgi:hypothetical protein